MISAHARVAKWLSMVATTISAASAPAGSTPRSRRKSKRMIQAIASAFQERLLTGWRPAPDDYADAPDLAGWRSYALRLPAGPATVLVGTVTGHPDFSDGTLIATGRVLAGDGARGWARTTRRYYRLGDSE